MARFELTCAWSVALLVGACGPQSGSDDTGADDGVSSTAGDDGSSEPADDGGSESSTPTGSNDDGSSDGGVPQACEPLVSDVGEGGPLQIVLRNEGPSTVFIGEPTDCILSPVAITGPDGAAFEIDPTLCLESCDAFLDATCSSIDCGACGGAEMIRLEPGGSWTHEWDGWIRESLLVPPDCSIDVNCDASCSRARLPAVGLHEFRASLHTECSTFDGMACACPAGEDACLVYADAFPEAIDSISAEASLPDTVMVELVIPPK